MECSDNVFMITGAASGMGQASAKCLASRGAKVALLDLNIKQATQVAKAIPGAKAFACDVTDPKSAEQAIQAVKEHFQGIHGCINCAGIASAARVVGRQGPMQLHEFSKVIQVNLIGTFNVIRLCAAVMLAQAPLNEDGERGVIINTASVAAFEGQLGQAAYSASKGGIVAMTLPIARELGQHGIRVVTIAPGVMDTPMMASMPESVQDSLKHAIPFPKRLGFADEYGQLVCDIIRNTYLNGTVIRLDGALRMGVK